MKNMISNRKCITRLSRYKNALKRLKALGFIKVFSDNLSDAAGVTPSQVRKDFSLFGITGNKRGGYKVDELIEQIQIILGKNEIQRVILVGAGRIGAALLRYKGFEEGGVRIVAAFDIDPAKYLPNDAVPIRPLEEMTQFIRDEKIRVGIITVPDSAAQRIAEIMAAAGIKGILNFAPIQLRGTDEVVINNINLESELENLIYFVNAHSKANPVKCD
jgi:redox-sensing transcriptional repressor